MTYEWWRGRIRTSVGRGPADLQSAAFDHSANSPTSLLAGAGDGTRTRDLLITNQLLYQLSYASAKPLDFKDTNSLSTLSKGWSSGGGGRGTAGYSRGPNGTQEGVISRAGHTAAFSEDGNRSAGGRYVMRRPRVRGRRSARQGVLRPRRGARLLPGIRGVAHADSRGSVSVLESVLLGWPTASRESGVLQRFIRSRGSASVRRIKPFALRRHPPLPDRRDRLFLPFALTAASSAAAAFGAISFALGGLMMSLNNLVTVLYAVSWMPWLALFSRRFFRDAAPRFRAGRAHPRTDPAHRRAVGDPAMRSARTRRTASTGGATPGRSSRHGRHVRDRAAGGAGANPPGARPPARFEPVATARLCRGDGVVVAAGAAAGNPRCRYVQPLLAGGHLLLAVGTPSRLPWLFSLYAGLFASALIVTGIGAAHSRMEICRVVSLVELRRRDRQAWAGLPLLYKLGLRSLRYPREVHSSRRSSC